MNENTADAVGGAHQSVRDYWARLYTEADEGNTRYSVEPDPDLELQIHLVDE